MPDVKSYNADLFKQLKYVAPDTTTEEPVSKPDPVITGSVMLTLPTIARDSGTFVFTYSDSNGNQIGTETKNMSIAAGKQLSFEVSGTDKQTYYITIENVKDSSKSGQLAKVTVDFSSGKAVQTVDEFNENLFNELKYNEQTPAESSGESSEPEPEPVPTEE